MNSIFTINIKIKNIGVCIYPACDVSNILIDLMPTKTFSRDDLETIKKLGYEIITKAQKL
jgi:hypothetical protein